jgi:hypothetical protein
MLHKGIALVGLDSGNKLLLVGRPQECWVVVTSNFEYIGDFDPKKHGAGKDYLGHTSLAKLSDLGISISGVLGAAIIQKLELAEVTPYLESRAGKYVR